MKKDTLINLGQWKVWAKFDADNGRAFMLAIIAYLEGREVTFTKTQQLAELFWEGFVVNLENNFEKYEARRRAANIRWQKNDPETTEKKPQKLKIDIKNFLSEKFKNEKFDAAWKNWLDYRRERKLSKYATPTLKRMAENFEAKGVDAAIESIETSIKNGWQGLFDAKTVTPFNSQKLEQTGFSTATVKPGIYDINQS